MPSYTMKITHWNPTANVFFEEAPENSSLIADRYLAHQSIYAKNNVDWKARSTTYSQEDGKYVRTTTITGFSSPEAVETMFDDVRNATFWQTHMFPWYRDNNVRGRFEILDEAGNLVKVLHDNRNIDSVTGDGPGSWEPYIPA